MKKILCLILTVLLVSSLILSSNITTYADGGECGDNLYWEFNESTKTLRIYGFGEMYAYGTYDDNSAPWYKYLSLYSKYPKIENVVFEEGITVIGAFSFIGGYSIKNIAFPKSLKKIEQYAFSSCTGLEYVTLNEGLEIIGEHSFDTCTRMRNIRLPDSLLEIGSAAFDECVNLGPAFYIPLNVKKIGSLIFYDCTKLETVYCATSKNGSGWNTPIKGEQYAFEVVWNHARPLMTGDVNLDMKITSADYLMLKKYFSNTYSFTDDMISCSDINRDNKLSSVDYLLLKKYFSGINKNKIGEIM